ncbi:hypothetical protein [Lonsdalea populi]|uniref:hypothetical protein n=2 Tax=Pectobacteriaceae TaxID=1903410 RepID=UPI0011BFBAE8|nr:hypothetical protein [Lonsdalea populi]
MVRWLCALSFLIVHTLFKRDFRDARIHHLSPLFQRRIIYGTSIAFNDGVETLDSDGTGLNLTG